MKTPEEQDPAWELLLKSKVQQPSPSFVRNVVREARKLEKPSSGLMAVFAWFKRPIIAVPVAIGATAALIAAFTLIQTLAPPTSSPETNSSSMPLAAVSTTADQEPAAPIINLLETTAPEADITEDVERIDYLGELVTIADPSELDDAALADLFF